MLRWTPPATVRHLAQAANPGFTRRQWALGGAWFFIGASMFGLSWIALSGGQGRIFGLESAGVDHAVWGLTYTGWAGTALLWMQIVAISSATVMTLLPVRRVQRLGHAVLIGWAAWWTLGTMYLASISPVGFGLQALLMTFLLSCTVARAWMSRGRFDSAPAPAACFDGAGMTASCETRHDTHASSPDAALNWRERLHRAGKAATNAIRNTAHSAWHRGLPAVRQTTVSVWRRLRHGFGSVGDTVAGGVTDPRIRV